MLTSKNTWRTTEEKQGDKQSSSNGDDDYQLHSINHAEAPPTGVEGDTGVGGNVEGSKTNLRNRRRRRARLLCERLLGAAVQANEA